MEFAWSRLKLPALLALLTFYADWLPAAEYRFPLPPLEYQHVPSIPPIIIYTTLSITNQRCRKKETEAKKPKDWVFYGCAIRIAGTDRYLIFVATDAPVPALKILRHEFGEVNGWRG